MPLAAALWNVRLRLVFGCLGAAGIAAYFILSPDTLPERVVYQAFSVAAFALLLARGLRTRGRDRLGWLCFTAGVLCFVGGDAIWSSYHFLLSREAPFPSIADVLYLAGYPFFILGSVLAFRSRRGHSLGSILEAGIVTAASGLVIWLTVIEPSSGAAGASLLERLTGAAYPTMDFLLVAALSPSLFRRRAGSRVLTIIAAALVLQTVADLLYARLSLSGLYATGSWVDGGWLLTYLLWGFAALSPRESTGSAKVTPSRSGLPLVPLSLMLLALLSPPVTLLIETAFDKPLELEAVLPVWLLIAVFVFARLLLLIRELVATQDVRHEQTQALRVQNALLEASERERARLLARTTEVAEHERMRIAGDLHDGPIQKLTVVAFKLDRLERRIMRHEEGTEPLVREIRNQLQVEMTALRRVMSDLRPPILDERNLAAALDDCAEQIFSDTSVEHHTTCRLGDEAPAPEVETAVYRVVREALLNVRRDGTVKRVAVEVERQGDSLHLLIRGDGGGFDDSAHDGHFGLLGMEERIGSVGGVLAVTSAPGIETRIEATLPWKPRASPIVRSAAYSAATART
jgi:signal transduction histidine kinase